MSKDDPRVCVLLRAGGRQALVAPWLDAVPATVEVVQEFDEDWSPPDGTALVVTPSHYEARDLRLLRRLQAEGRTGVLILSDGILEYRNTWENPKLPPGALFQPVRGHKIACLGRSQVRTLEAWGNVGRCELVGLPCLDAMLGRRPRVRAGGEPFRILVTTALTPAFSPEQRTLVRRSLADLRYWQLQNPRVGGVRLELVWRLTGELEASLGLPAARRLDVRPPLAQALEGVDAVITTPSTVQLEAMLQGVPVALLDYTNSPAYVPAAWSITAPRHLESVLPQLVDPPAPRRLHQHVILHDALECHTPAAPRMQALVEAMLTAVDVSRSDGTPLRFPPRILVDEHSGHSAPEPSWDLAALFPDATALRETDLGRLQRRTAELEHVSRRLPWVEQERAAAEAEARLWRRRYERLANLPALKQLLWVRQRLKASLAR
jgi:hypothetical protein